MPEQKTSTRHASLPGLRRVMQRLWPYMRRQRGLIVGSIFALVAGVGFRLLEPWPLKFIIDRVIKLGPSSASSPGGASLFGFDLEAMRPEKLALLAAGAFVLITACRALCEYANAVGFAKIGNRVLTAVRNDLFRHVQRLDLPFHGTARGGDLVVRLLGDVNMLRDAASSAVLPLAANALVLAGMWTVMFWLQWNLAALALATVPLLGLRTVTLTARIRQVARKQRRRQGEMAAVAGESVTAIKTVQAMGLEDEFSNYFDRRSDDAQKQDVKGAKLSAKLARSVDVLLAIATGLVLWYGTTLVLRGQFSPGEMIVFLTYLRRAFNPMQDFAKYTSRLAKATAAGERVLDLLDRQPAVDDLPGAVEAPALRGHVVLEDVSFAYEPGSAVLEHLSLEIRPGEWVALVGQSGIGKSTLANLILRLHDPGAGRVLIDGMDVKRFTLESLRRQVAVVLQDGQLFALSARENIALALPGCTNEQIQSAARLANADAFIAALPQGYETIFSERGASLSGGQRQRIAIARAAIRDAPILILDEPTSGLDEENEQTVVDALERLAAGRTTLLITHDLALASRAHRIVYLENGRVLECGSHEQLLRLGGRYAAVFGLQNTTPTRSPRRRVDGSEGETETHALII